MRKTLLPPVGLLSAGFAAQSASAASLKEAAEALGVATTKSIEFTATGRWFQFGQAPNPSLAWPQFDVTRYVADIDYTKTVARVQIVRKQTIEAGRVRPTPTEQRVDQYVSGSVAWNLNRPANAQPGTASTPAAQPLAVEERVAEIWATPQGFLRAAQANGASEKPAGDGVDVSFTLGGKYRYLGHINGRNQVDKVQTWIDTPVLGDTVVETVFSDYKDFAGVSFPARIARSEGGYPVLDLTVGNVRPNATVDVLVPQEVVSAKTAPTVTSTKLADGVFYLTGGTHHSVVVEQGDHLVLIEAPLNEERSQALLAKLKESFPGKPVKYLVNTHAHFDHLGGVRTFVDEGAIIVTHKTNEAYYAKIWAASHDLTPDRLAKSRKAPRFETFTDKLVLSDGKQPVEVHTIVGSGHDDAFALAYLPAAKVLVEADAYTPTAADVPPPKEANPYSVNLYENIQRLKLDVGQIAALHGPRVVTLADLRTYIGLGATASK